MAYAHFEETSASLTGWKKLVAYLFGTSKRPKNKDTKHFDQAESEPKKHLESTPEEKTFTPQRYFLGLIQATIKEGLPRKYSLSGSGCADIVVLPEKNLYYSSAKLEELTAIFEASADKIKISLINLKKLDNIMDQLMAKSRPMDDLLWCAAFAGSKGRLLTTANADEIIQLKYWPDIAHLPNSAQNLPIAAFLNGNAAHLNTVTEHTQIPLPAIYNFYNACETLGYLDKGVPARIQDKPAHTPDKDLYNTISATLGGVRTTDTQKQ